MITGIRMVVALLATIAIVSGVVAGALALTGAGARTGSPEPSVSAQLLRWSPGACVRRTGARYDLTACNGGHSEVLAVAADPPGLGGCPDDTDDVVRIGQARTACVRDFLDPHPGAPGGGGGVLRAGDCVALDGRERACSRPGWYGRAVAIVNDASGCPAGTLDTLTADGVICLGRGGRVLERGMCVARPARDVVTRSAIARVACSSGQAWARVRSFEPSAARCPEGSDHYLESRGAYRPVTCLRLRSK
ncbi:hypothetical protein [Nonomuraea sp. NPDC048916]|uniref:hypothetical protein n=1 Tax=Nonomuraea sp. NPDC048916 TaxID=3154232 RepID=UPI0033EECC2C